MVDLSAWTLPQHFRGGMRQTLLRRSGTRATPGVLARASAAPDALAESAAGNSAKAAPPFDPLRDGPLRFCGYANEVGEAFGAWLPVFGVPLSYAVAITYVLVDTADKTLRAHSDASEWSRNVAEDAVPLVSALGRKIDRQHLVTLLASERALDTLTWQMLASVIIPGSTIHMIVWAVHEALQQGLHTDDIEHMPAVIAAAAAPALAAAAAALHASGPQEVASLLEKVIPTATGLAAIPFIVHPIDNAVHFLLDNTLRPYAKSAICNGAGGADAGVDFCVLPSYESGSDSEL